MISASNPSRKNRERFAIKKSYSIENGYPSRRRSLVGDARFETQVNREAKKSWLEEIRQVSRDSEISEDDLLFAVDDDAVFSTGGPDADINLPKVLEEISPISEVEKEEKAEESAIIISLKDEIIAFTRILKTIDNCKATITHMESRQSHEVGTKWDILVKMNIKRQNLMILVKSLRQSYSIQKVSIITPINSIKEPWYPKHISGLDLCNHLMTKYEPDLDMDHPGFSDKSYRARRKIIADIAFDFRYGEQIPRVEYNASEIATWGHVFTQLVKLLPTHACKPFRNIFAVLQKEVGYRADNIPQLQDVSDFLKKRTGFSLRPAAGLLTARDFLSSLAFRVFQCTQYVRHGSSPDHSPEPDCIHELLGHVPMLADPLFAQFSQELGLYSLGVSDEEIEKISTLYWFTVEFGLCKENGIVKAYGAGLLSSYGELEHSLSDKPEHRVFIPDLAAVQPYQDQDYQDVYYVAESFEDVKNKFRQWVIENLSSRKYEIRYNAFTETINALDSVDKLEDCLAQMKIEMTYLANAIGLLKFR